MGGFANQAILTFLHKTLADFQCVGNTQVSLISIKTKMVKEINVQHYLTKKIVETLSNFGFHSPLCEIGNSINRVLEFLGQLSNGKKVRC